MILFRCPCPKLKKCSLSLKITIDTQPRSCLLKKGPIFTPLFLLINIINICLYYFITLFFVLEPKVKCAFPGVRMGYICTVL